MSVPYPPFPVKILAALHFVLGAGALFGGGALMIRPDGSLLGMPVGMLEGSVFPDFLIPGAILFGIFGLLPVYLSIAVIRKWPNRFLDRLNIFRDKHWSWICSLYVGYGICIWIITQVYIISGIHAIHLVYFFWGIFLQVLTLLPRSQNWFLKQPADV